MNLSEHIGNMAKISKLKFQIKNHPSGRAVLWNMDNQAAVLIVELGSMKPRLMKLAQDINEIIKKNNIRLQVEWLRRTSEEIRFCDKLSKAWDLTDYRISEEDFLYDQ